MYKSLLLAFVVAALPFTRSYSQSQESISLDILDALYGGLDLQLEFGSSDDVSYTIRGRYAPSRTIHYSTGEFDTISATLIIPKTETTSISWISVGAGVRKYFNPKDLYHSGLWVGAELFYERLFLDGTPLEGTRSSDVFALDLGLGYKWFLGKSITIDPSVGMYVHHDGIGAPAGVEGGFIFEMEAHLRVGYVISPASVVSKRGKRKRRRRSKG